MKKNRQTRTDRSADRWLLSERTPIWLTYTTLITQGIWFVVWAANTFVSVRLGRAPWFVALSALLGLLGLIAFIANLAAIRNSRRRL
ncbi:MAG: hypothetical protein J6K95_03485 [Rikenellaceae bacterium]|nr:hypothetical protein [Rikenellaceae bacterium]